MTRQLSENLRARWAPHSEMPTLFMYLEPLKDGSWIPERLGIGEVQVCESESANQIFHFDQVTEEDDALVMTGGVEGLWAARLEFRLQDSGTGRVQVRRRFTRLGPSAEMAIEQSVIIDNGGWWPGNHLVLPSFDYDGNPHGKNPYPRPEPIPGFAVRADRLGQPMIFYQDLQFSYGLAARNEHPSFPGRETPPPSLVYSFAMRPWASPVRLAIRYPHDEYAQEGTGPGQVYHRKNRFTEEPIVTFALIEQGESIEDEIYVWVFPIHEELHDYSVMTRFLFELNLPEQAAPQHDSLLDQFRKRMDYVHATHYNAKHGHYESHADRPGIAMLGFTECAELQAGLSIYQGNLDSIDERVARGLNSIQEWISHGSAADGALKQVSTLGGGYGGDSLVTRRMFEVGERFLSISDWLKRFGIPYEEPLRAGLAQADWLIAHALPDGSFARQYRLDGSVLDDSPCHTAYAVHLLAEAGRHSGEARYLAAAERGFAAYEKNTLATEAFYGATLDAHTEDKEAAIAGLEAALVMHRVTKDARYLAAARIAADHVLTYTWAYRMDTFEPDTSAVKRGINTFGALIVSPENEHLDPFNTIGLIDLGLLLDDPLYVKIGIQSLWWALDGRWAIEVAGAGAKQPEQFIQTDWFYAQEWVRRRGEYRDVPEVGWTSVHPSYQFLKVGGALIYADLMRGVGIDGCEIVSIEGEPSDFIVTLRDTLGRDHDVLLVLRNASEGGYLVDGEKTESIVLETGLPIELAGGGTRAIRIRKA